MSTAIVPALKAAQNVVLDLIHNPQFPDCAQDCTNSVDVTVFCKSNVDSFGINFVAAWTACFSQMCNQNDATAADLFVLTHASDIVRDCQAVVSALPTTLSTSAFPIPQNIAPEKLLTSFPSFSAVSSNDTAADPPTNTSNQPLAVWTITFILFFVWLVLYNLIRWRQKRLSDSRYFSSDQRLQV